MLFHERIECVFLQVVHIACRSDRREQRSRNCCSLHCEDLVVLKDEAEEAETLSVLGWVRVKREAM
jgi:hypothetical protein